MKTDKQKQMELDHQAMQIFRKHNGDLKLTFFVCGGGIDVMTGKLKPSHGYECNIFQHDWSEKDVDPSKAIIKAYKRWKKLKAETKKEEV